MIRYYNSLYHDIPSWFIFFVALVYPLACCVYIRSMLHSVVCNEVIFKISRVSKSNAFSPKFIHQRRREREKKWNLDLKRNWPKTFSPSFLISVFFFFFVFCLSLFSFPFFFSAVIVRSRRAKQLLPSPFFLSFSERRMRGPANTEWAPLWVISLLVHVTATASLILPKPGTRSCNAIIHTKIATPERNSDIPTAEIQASDVLLQHISRRCTRSVCVRSCRVARSRRSEGGLWRRGPEVVFSVFEAIDMQIRMASHPDLDTRSFSRLKLFL